MSGLNARIEPLRALLYDPGKVGDISRVIAPPYDIIGDTLQKSLYERSPYNIVRLELGRDADRYGAARDTLREWIDKGVLRRGENPAIYLYTQRFQVENRSFSRTGFIVRFRLEEFAPGRILPHEKTFPAAKEDRLKLLAATRVNISSIFGLYSGVNPALERLRAEVSSRKPLFDAADDLGIRNELRAIEAPEEIAIVQRSLESAPVLIADGHHRYETALNYRNLRRAEGASAAAAGFDYTMMTLVACDDPGLLILPTHRVARRLRPDAMQSFEARAAAAFEVTRISDREKLRQAMEKHGAGALGVALRGNDSLFLLRLRDAGAVARAAPEAPAAVRNLDVTVLHTLLLDRIFSLRAAEIRKGGILEYTIDANGALDAVGEGRADGAFLMNPPTVADVERVSKSGATMPEKSTYFHPKLTTGLVLNPLDE